jgi:lipoprotein signal peptidase
VAIAAGAEGELIDRLAQQLVVDKTVRIDHAIALLNAWKADR